MIDSGLVWAVKSVSGTKRTNRDVCYLSAFGAKRTLNRAALSKRIYEYTP